MFCVVDSECTLHVRCIMLSKESSFVMLAQSMCCEKVTKIFVEKHPSSAVSCKYTEWWKSTKQQVVKDKKTYITTVCFDWWEIGWYRCQNGTSSRKALLQLVLYMATKLLRLGQYKMNPVNSFNLSGKKKGASIAGVIKNWEQVYLLIQKLFFSDEAWLILSGNVNIQNNR